MKVLHLSDSPLSGAPTRLSNLLSKHGGIASRHISWARSVFGRVVPVDLVGSEMTKDGLLDLIQCADIIHYHNRWKRSRILTELGMGPPNKPSLIQIHSPRYDTERFDEEAESGVPLAIIAQYHVREWPELQFIVPNVVDITEIVPADTTPHSLPIISFAPSNCTGKGWNNKGYSVVAPVLKRMKMSQQITFQLIVNTPYDLMMSLKSQADIGIDEVVTGSYHLSSLEYLALGVPCFANLDDKTERVLKDITGCVELPWIKSTPSQFAGHIKSIVAGNRWLRDKKISTARIWMEKYWNPSVLVRKYLDVYRKL